MFPKGDISAEGLLEYSGESLRKVNSQEGRFSDGVAFHSRWEGKTTRKHRRGHQGRVTFIKVEVQGPEGRRRGTDPLEGLLDLDPARQSPHTCIFIDVTVCSSPRSEGAERSVQGKWGESVVRNGLWRHSGLSGWRGEKGLEGSSVEAGLPYSGWMGSNLEPIWLQKNSEVVSVENQLAWKGTPQSTMVD